MPKRMKHEVIIARHFRWIVKRRGGVWYADGRSSKPNLGRHSLGTRDRGEALQRVQRLDSVKAVEHGIADGSALAAAEPQSLCLEDGVTLYMDHLSRPAVAGGASPKTRQRYQAVFDKFIQFARTRGVTTWQRVNTALVERYLAHLETRGYGEATLYFEGTVITQLVKWGIGEKALPADCKLNLKLRKINDTSTYCYRPEEVDAMLARCRKDNSLRWLADVILLLSRTGLRISEAAQLRRSDVDLEQGTLHVRNDPQRLSKQNGNRRQTKNRTGRSFPIHPDLQTVLERLPHRKDGRVLGGPRGGRLKPDTVRNVLVTQVITPLSERFPSADDELGFKDGRLHSFRHFFCSQAAGRGVPERVVMTWLGHADSAMITRYFHLHDADAKRQMSQLSFSGPTSGDVATENGPDGSEAPPGGQASGEKS